MLKRSVGLLKGIAGCFAFAESLQVDAIVSALRGLLSCTDNVPASASIGVDELRCRLAIFLQRQSSL